MRKAQATHTRGTLFPSLKRNISNHRDSLLYPNFFRTHQTLYLILFYQPTYILFNHPNYHLLSLLTFFFYLSSLFLFFIFFLLFNLFPFFLFFFLFFFLPIFPSAEPIALVNLRADAAGPQRQRHAPASVRWLGCEPVVQALDILGSLWIFPFRLSLDLSSIPVPQPPAPLDLRRQISSRCAVASSGSLLSPCCLL